MQLLREYLKTPEGKKTLTANGSGIRLSIKEMQRYGEKMADILYRHIVAVIPSFQRTDIIVGKLKQEKEYILQISFDEESLKRDSLYPKKYEGLEDIVLAFSAGWHAENYVYGVWEGHGENRIRSRKKRKANPYLKKAVAEFNAVAPKNIRAELNSEYTRTDKG